MSTLVAGVGEGGGVVSMAMGSTSPEWDCLRRLLGWESGDLERDDELRGDADDAEELERRALLVEALCAARAAAVMGTWMPRLGSDSDLRRVL